MIFRFNDRKRAIWIAVVMSGVSPHLHAAQFTFNVPLNHLYFEPNAEFEVTCGLYRQDEELATHIKKQAYRFNQAGQYAGLVSIEFDGIPRPAEVTHYSCYSSAIQRSPFGPEGSCWSSTQAAAETECEEQMMHWYLNGAGSGLFQAPDLRDPQAENAQPQEETYNRYLTGKTPLPIQYEY